NATSDANQLARGIVVQAASSNVEIRNNIVDGVTDEGIVVATNALGGASFDAELLGTTGSCPVRWGATVPTSGQPNGGTCGSLAAFAAANPPNEASGITGSPAFVRTADPVDLHIQPPSRALDMGIALGTFATDIDGDSRPSGAAWDIGADEYVAPGSTTTT